MAWKKILAGCLLAWISTTALGQGQQPAPPQPQQVHYRVALEGPDSDYQALAAAIAGAFSDASDFDVSGTGPIGQNAAETRRQELMALDGTSFPHPVNPQGKPIGPPVKLPNTPQGNPNSWKPVKGTPSRPIKWVPTQPINSPGGGQPGGSWDPENKHWDIDNGTGERTRVTPEGEVVDHNNKPLPEQRLPAPFDGLDPAVIAQYAAVGLVVIGVIIAVGTAIIEAIFGGWGIAVSCLPMILPGGPALQPPQYAYLQPDPKQLMVQITSEQTTCGS